MGPLPTEGGASGAAWGGGAVYLSGNGVCVDACATAGGVGCGALVNDRMAGSINCDTCTVGVETAVSVGCCWNV